MSQAAFHFQTLDLEAVVEAICNTGIRVDSGLTALNSYENRVWQFSDEDKRRYVAKFYRPQRWNEAQLLEEHQFTHEMAQAGIPVADPVRLSGKTLHQTHDIWFALFPSLGGRQYEMDNYDHLEQAARVMAEIHQVGRKSLFQSRPAISLTEYIDEPYKILSTSELVPSVLRGKLIQCLNELSDVLKQLWHDNWQSLRLHGDSHPGNILWRDGPLFVDLDDARNGPAVQDLWMLVSGDLKEQRIQWDILLEAYSSLNDFDINELSLIEPLRTMRMVYYLSWIIKLWQDPAFPRAFPWLKEQDFWRRQLAQFSEQQHRLNHPLPLLMPQY